MNQGASLPALQYESRLKLVESLTGLIIIAMALLTLGHCFLAASPSAPVMVTELAYAIALLGGVLLARRSQSLEIPGLILLLGLLLLIFVVAQQGGGLDSPALLALPFTPLLTALLLGRRRLPLFVGFVVLLLVGLYGVQMLELIEAQAWAEPMLRIQRISMVVVMLLLCGWLGYYCDRENDRMHHQLTLWANTDSLTGVANRRFFDHCLHQEWLRNQRVARPLSLLLLDIDHFKRYNDAHGHVEGDRCLTAIAQALANHCRRSGELVARYGGEEFAVILPNVDLSEAAAIADSLRIDIGSLYEKGHPALKEAVTVSIGFASAIPCEVEQQERFIVQADQALYRAKRAGRNQSVGSMTPSNKVRV